MNQQLHVYDTVRLGHSTSFAQGVDVLGLRLGMRNDEATRIVNAQFPGARGTLGEAVFKGAPPVPVVFFYRNGTSWSNIHLDFAGPPAPRTVTRIIRYETYPPGQEPNHAETVKAVIAKYGKPSKSHKGVAFTWLFDSSGVQQPATQVTQHCGGSFEPSPEVENYGARLSQLTTLEEHQRSGEFLCGVVLHVEVSQHSNQLLAQSVAASLVDHRTRITAALKMPNVRVNLPARAREEP
jgi:hypothetical protein